MGKNSKNTSAQLPPIHIHMSTSNDHATSGKDQKRHGKSSNSQPMSREHSWDRDSGTASFNDNSSVHTADDSVFSEPFHHRDRAHHRHRSRTPPNVTSGAGSNMRSRNLPLRQDTTTANTACNHNYNYPHPSHIYDDAPHQTRLPPLADDYPHARNHHQQPYLDSTIPTPFSQNRPLPHRRNTTHPNPFDTTRFPAPTRAMSYAAGMGMGVGMGMVGHSPRFPNHDHDHDHAHLHFDEFHDELERIRERDGPHKALYRRGVEQRRQGVEARARGWDEAACCLPEARRGAAWDGYTGGLGGRW